MIDLFKINTRYFWSNIPIITDLRKYDININACSSGKRPLGQMTSRANDCRANDLRANDRRANDRRANDLEAMKYIVTEIT